MNHIHPVLRDFILFCVKRRSAAWPAIYDEMATVASQRLFRNLDYAALKQLGLSLSITNLEVTAMLVKTVISEETTK